MSEKLQAVTALLFNEEGKILAVSRRDNHNDFGLPGGKLDEGETHEQAIIREVKEETGLELSDLKEYYVREDVGYISTTYLAKHTGMIKPKDDKEGVVKWTDFEELKKGSFGIYNKALEEFYNNNK